MEGADLVARGRRAVVGAAVGTAAMGLLAGLAACGAGSSSSAVAGAPVTSSAPVTSGAPATSGASGSPASSAGGCAGAPSGSTAGTALTLTEADNGRTVCITTGQHVAVRLAIGGARVWTVGVEGTALVAAPDGSGALPRGVQGASYRADHPGTARIVATRTACPSPRPGEVACMAVEQAWSVSVVVR